jgi:hypothetical protein
VRTSGLELSDFNAAVSDLMSDDFPVYHAAIGRIASMAPAARLPSSSGAGKRLRYLLSHLDTPQPSKLQIQALFASVVASVRRERQAKRVAADMLGSTCSASASVAVL